MTGQDRDSRAREPRRILIVDDVFENLSVLHGILAEDGYSFSVATNAAETFEILKKQIPDLILLDVMLPDLDGFSLCERIKSDSQTTDVPVVFLSGKIQVEDKVRGFAAGGVDYITKPYDAYEVQARVRTHVRLKKMQDALRESNEAKRKLFSIIAHDLMGPVTGAFNLAEMMAEESGRLDPAQMRELANELGGSMRGIITLLENLLAWAQALSDGIPIRKETLNLRTHAEEAVALFARPAAEKGIAIENEIPAGVSVFADAESLDTILRNCLSNAVKFSNSGSTVVLRTERRSEYAAVSISDGGIGISPDKLEGIFGQPVFSRTYGTNREKGIGLGLRLVKEFVELNGGAVSIESEVGKGTKLRFTLPVIEADGGT